MKKPHKGYTDREVERFNREVPVGAKVIFWSLRKPWREPVRTRTRSKAWALGHGDGVVKVEGKCGGVAISHVEILPEVADDDECPDCGGTEGETCDCPHRDDYHYDSDEVWGD